MPAYDSQTVDGTFFVDNGFKHNHSLNASLERQWWIRRHGATNHIALLNALADADRLIVRYKGWFGLGGFWWRRQRFFRLIYGFSKNRSNTRTSTGLGNIKGNCCWSFDDPGDF